MKSYSLGAKFTILFFILFFVPYSVLTFFSVSMSKEMMERSTTSHLQNLAEVKELAIEQWLKERIQDGMTIAESQEIKSLDPKRMKSFLSLVKNFERSYLDIGVLNLKGKIISSDGHHSKNSFEKEEWFQRALRDGAFITTAALPNWYKKGSREFLTSKRAAPRKSTRRSMMIIWAIRS